MRDYTYQDMLKMQEEAAKRVREMKKRATMAMEDDSEKQSSVSPLPDEVKHISYPVEIETVTEETETAQSSDDNANNKKSFIQYFTEDKDALLILTMIAVLSDEKVDFTTTAMLAYLLL